MTLTALLILPALGWALPGLKAEVPPLPSDAVPAVDPSVQKMQANWQTLQSYLPAPYYERIQKTPDLRNSREFQQHVMSKQLESFDVQLRTVAARQNFLDDFAKCCPGFESKKEDPRRIKRQIFSNFPFFPFPAPPPIPQIPLPQVPPTVPELADYARTLKNLQETLDNLLLRTRQLAERIFGDCKASKECSAKFDPELLNIVRGKRDAAVSDGFWQGVFAGNPLFPPLYPYNFFQPFQTAWNNLLNGFYGFYGPQTPAGPWFAPAFPPVGYYGPQFTFPTVQIPAFPPLGTPIKNETFSSNGVNGTVLVYGGDGKPSGTVVTGVFGNGQNGGGVFTSQQFSSSSGPDFSSTVTNSASSGTSG